MMRWMRRTGRGFTLIEVLCVAGLIALLIALLLPGLSHSRRLSRRTACLSNLHQLGLAIHLYASGSRGFIPYGPKAPPFTATNFYPVTGSVTSLISLESGDAVGLGLMLARELSKAPQALFCPDADQVTAAEEELAKVGTAQAQCDFYYRHASGGSIYVPPGTAHLRLDDLGRNSDGIPIRALVMDVNYLVDPSLQLFHVVSRTSHRRQTVNVLFSAGHAAALTNAHNQYTIDVGARPYESFPKILRAFELADRKWK